MPRIDHETTISTHAPARGATDASHEAALTWQFLLTPLREGRPASSMQCLPRAEFLLTPLREGRRTSRKGHGLRAHFYSRPCERGDAALHVPAAFLTKFLLTPLREGRRYLRQKAGYQDRVFLLTPLREGRQAGIRVLRPGEMISTHAPARGATPLPRHARWRDRHFYSRPCERGD